MNKILQLFLHHYFYFSWLNFLSVEIVDVFPKCWNLQICHTHQAFKLPLHTFSGKLWTFLTVKSKTIGFLLNLTQRYTPVLFTKIPCELLPEKELLSGHYAANSEVAGTCHTAHMTPLCALWKLLKGLGRTTSSASHITLQLKNVRTRQSVIVRTSTSLSHCLLQYS